MIGDDELRTYAQNKSSSQSYQLEIEAKGECNCRNYILSNLPPQSKLSSINDQLTVRSCFTYQINFE